MNIDKLIDRILAFRDARDWKQFHNAKDMAAALAIEAAELQELFLWKSAAEVDAVVKSKRTQLEDEVADIGIYLLELAHNLDIDLEQVIIAKLAKNDAKYPAEKVRGSSKKYNEYSNAKSPSE